MRANRRSERNVWAPRVAVAVLCMAMAFLGIVSSAAAYTPVPVGAPITPNPYVEGNVTVAQHLGTMGVFGYIGDNGIANNLGNTPTGSPAGFQVDPLVTKPYVVDFTQVASIGLLQNYQLGGGTNKWVNLTSNWAKTGSGGTDSLTLGSVGSSQATSLVFKTTGTAGGATTWTFTLTTAYTGSMSLSRFVLGGSDDLLPAGTKIYVNITDGTSTVGYAFDPTSTSGAQTSALHVLSAAAAKNVLYQDRINSIGSSTTLTQVSSVAVTIAHLGTQAAQITVRQLAFTSGAYLQFGTDSSANAVYVQDAGNTTGMALATFAPTFFYNQVQNFKVAFWLPAATLVGNNASESDAVLNEASGFSRLVTFSFNYILPSVLQVTYANTKLVDAIAVTTTQYVAVSLNGANVTTTYTPTALKVAALVTLQSSVSPGTNYLLIESIRYTPAQWDSISQSPVAGGFLTAAWLQIIGIFALILSVFGLGAWAAGIGRAGKEFSGGKGGAPPIK